MARTKAHDANQKAFTMPDTETKQIKTLHSVPPTKRRDLDIMSDDGKRDFSSMLINNLITSIKMPRVTSNKELEERASEYLQMCAEKRIPPVWEGLSLYLGYSRATLWDWMSGRNKGFSDETESGSSTSVIVKRLRETFAAYDATMSITGNINPVSYIFRSSNYYGLTQRSTVAVEPQSDLQRPPMTPEEIARDLPDLTDGGLIDLLGETSE